MTRRERLEAKVEQRQAWADWRREKAATLEACTERFRGDWAFNTQPGHIPERARVIAKIDKAFEHRDMAAHHAEKAAGLERQLDRSIFSDDADAIQALEARIAEGEAKRTRMKAVNAAYRKGNGAALETLGLNLETLRERLSGPGVMSWDRIPYPAYELTNLGSRIRADRDRIEQIRRRTARTEQAEANGGVLIEGGEYVRVTFAEKPERPILEALKSAGFQWGSGAWSGTRAKLPTFLHA
jgi:hypothetical protein